MTVRLAVKTSITLACAAAVFCSACWNNKWLADEENDSSPLMINVNEDPYWDWLMTFDAFTDVAGKGSLALTDAGPTPRDQWSHLMATKGHKLIQAIYDADPQVLRDPAQFTKLVRELGIDFNADVGQFIKGQIAGGKPGLLYYENASEIERQRLTYMIGLAAISHALHQDGVDPASSGAYGIDEPDGQRLKNIFFRYAALSQGMSTEQVAAINDEDLTKNIDAGLNPHARNRTAFRKSSHLKNPALDRVQIGIDMRIDPKQRAMDILPGQGKTHILMGDWLPRAGAPRQSYFKFEDIGTGTRLDYFFHLIKLLKKFFSKEYTTTRREDELPLNVGQVLLKNGYKKGSKLPISKFLEEREHAWATQPEKLATFHKALDDALEIDRAASGGYEVDIELQAGRERHLNFRERYKRSNIPENVPTTPRPVPKIRSNVQKALEPSAEDDTPDVSPPKTNVFRRPLRPGNET